MNVLGLDIGSSSVKAGIVRGGRIIGRLVRVPFPTCFDGIRAEVDPRDVLSAITSAIRQIGPAARKVDLIGLSVMSPAWVAMDRKGNPLTPLVTHQDRRSVEIAIELERRVGRQWHLRLAGNRPFPGSISSTTFLWFAQNRPGIMKRADLVGHLNTFIHRQITARVIDPSNASFTGLYKTITQGGWSDELCHAVKISRSLLPEVKEANQIGDVVHSEAARRFGLLAGTPVAVGMIDTSAAMLLAGARIGQLMNVSGSTDVLGLCTDHPHPHERLLTRALGIGRKWMSVSTLAAAGSALSWAREQLFADLSLPLFYKLQKKLAAARTQSSVQFAPYLAGERTSIEQKQAAFTGLTLATTREEMLAAIIESLAKASAARLPLLAECGTRMLRTIIVSGGMDQSLGHILHCNWPGHWKFKVQQEASLRGLSLAMPQ